MTWLYYQHKHLNFLLAILHSKLLILLFLSCQVSELSYYQKNFIAIIFQLMRPVKEGRWLSSYSKLQDNSCVWILRRSIFRIYLVIKIHILGYIWAPIFPKIRISPIFGRKKLVDPSRWRQDSIYYWCFHICILRW